MKLINGCSTVNCGVIRPIRFLDTVEFVELLGPGFTSHKNHVVCWYDRIDDVKTEIALSFDSKGMMIVVYKFRDLRDSQHYWSRAYNLQTLPTKYKKGYMVCKTAYDQIFARS